MSFSLLTSKSELIQVLICFYLVHELKLNSLLDNNTRLVSSSDIQRSYNELWKRLDPDTDIKETSTIEEALGLASKISDQYSRMQALITGSQHLVGGALRILKPNLFARETGSQPF